MSRPFINEGGVLGEVLFEARAFGSTLEYFNCFDNLGKRDWRVAGHTSLYLVRPGEKGRMPIFSDKAKQPGAFFDLNWEQAFKMAYARSKEIFAAGGNGEQIFASPGPFSRLVLVDDVKTPEPLLKKTLCIVLETSRENYQHLYCTDRVLSQDERRHIQQGLVAAFGGDMAATGGAQPHRVPGSINYKRGRGLWVCRLVGNVTEIDGGRPLASAHWLSREIPDVCAKKDAAQEPRARARTMPASGVVSASEVDWAWAIRRIAGLRSRGMDMHQLASLLTDELAARARERRGKDAERYARKTLQNLSKRGYLYL